MGGKKASAKSSVKGDFKLEQVGFFEVVIKLVDVWLILLIQGSCTNLTRLWIFQSKIDNLAYPKKR